MAKLDNKKLMVCCANGAGSSLMMKQTLQKVLKKFDIKPAQLHHCAVSEGKSAAANFDVVFCAKTFLKNFEGAKEKGTVVLGLKNIMGPKGEAEMEVALKEADLLD